MSGFSFSDLNELGEIAVESINNLIAPGYRGDINRVNAGDALIEHNDHHNAFVLGSGRHGGFLLEKPHGSIWGEPGVIVNRLATIKEDTVIQNVYFKQEDDENNKQQLVIVASGSVVFSNCIFQRRYDAERSNAAATRVCFVLVEDGAKAVFSNCVFRSNYSNGAMNGVGFAIQNLNALATNVFVGTGANYSTHTHNNVTLLGGEIS